MARFVLGVNGGGSKTDAVIADESGRIVWHGHAPGAGNERLVGIEGQRARLTDAIDQAVAGSGQPIPPFAAARIFLPSSGTPMREVLDAPGLRERFESIDDCQGHECSIAATGALGKGYARYNIVVLVAGTGSVGWAHARDGRTCTAGGWGETLGDEGSAYSVAMRGLRAAIHGSDGVAEATTLTERAVRFFGLDRLHDLMNAVYRKGGIPRETFCAFCPEVFAAAGAGDAAAVRALRAEGQYLASLAAALIGRLEMTGQQVYVIPSGSVWRGGGEFTKAFAAALASAAPGTTILKPLFDPAVGAALEALASLGIPLNAQTIVRVRESLPEALGAG